MPPAPPGFDVSNLAKSVQDTRSKLILLCGEAEGLLESHFSTILASYEKPLENLTLFPYYSNYIKLSQLEFKILTQHVTKVPEKIAFVGSGPLPLTSIVLATNHLTATSFHNYDINPIANELASRLVETDPDLSNRMFFHTADIMDLTSDEIKDYEVIFLAALVGMSKEEKIKIIEHLGKFMAPGALLMLRSAHGARAFLYPVVDPCDLKGFQVLSVYHPTDEVINSVVIARKYPIGSLNLIDQTAMILPNNCKCSEIHPFIKHEEFYGGDQVKI
jgi:nicotianamine synthase